MADTAALLRKAREEAQRITATAADCFLRSLTQLLSMATVSPGPERVMKPEGLKKYGFKDNLEALAMFKEQLKDIVIGRTESTSALAQLIMDVINETPRFVERGGLLPLLEFIKKAVKVRDYCITLEADPSTLTPSTYAELQTRIADLVTQYKVCSFLVPRRPITLRKFLNEVQLGPLQAFALALAEAVVSVSREEKTQIRKA